MFGSVDKRMRKELELYIHIPFCMKKCQYCDFLSFQADEHTQHEYVEALLREIAYYGARCQDYTVTSIDIVGMLSWLDEELTLRIMDAVRCSFLLAQDAEISIERNPGTVTDESLPPTGVPASTASASDYSLRTRRSCGFWEGFIPMSSS